MIFLSVTMGIPFHEIRYWSAAEIMLYQCYYRIAPWGEERGDIRNAMLMAQTANMHRDRTKHPQPFEVSEFMPFSEPPEPKTEAAGLREMFKAMSGKKDK